MTLAELFQKTTHRQLPPDFAARQNTPSGKQQQTNSARSSRKSRASFYQFSPQSAADAAATVRDSIHLDVGPLDARAQREAGARVRVWDGFAHRTLFERAWYKAVAFQPLSTRFETSRRDSPVEGFVFRLWEWGEEDTRDTFTLGRPERGREEAVTEVIGLSLR